MRLQHSQSTEVTVLRHETTSRRKLPVNFKQEDLPLFNHELERVIPETRLLELSDVSLSAEGVLFRRGEMLAESFAFPHTRANWKRRSVVKFFFSNYVLRKRRRFESASVWVIDDWSYGYFHWLADVLPRLMVIKEQLKDLVLVLPQKYRDLEFVQASLKPFVMRGLEFIDSDEVVFCKRLVVPMHTAPSGHYNDELIQEVRNLLVQFYASNDAGPNGDRVYISRGLAPKRKILNEEEVVAVLREFNFRIIHPEHHSFREQVTIAAGARYLVSNHGAGLTNMLFMNPGTSVIELRHRNDPVNNCYFTLASALNLNYFYQACQAEQSGEDPHTANLRVDVRTLRENVQLMLGF